MVNKIDSNSTGLSIAKEETLGVLPSTPVWDILEPNGYSDFGGQITTIARNPLNPSRQRKKGVTTDLDASGGFGSDVTQTNLTDLMQGFAFALIREKLSTRPRNAVGVAVSGVTAADDTYAAASGLASFLAGDLILASLFAQAANNGLKRVASSSSTTVVVIEALVDETPATTAKLQKIGFQFGTGEVDINVSGSYPRLVRASGTKDFTTFGLIPGEWIFIGGDTSTFRFTAAADNGFARVRAVAATYIEFDKTASTMTAETGTAKTIRIFYGNVIRNEPAVADIVRTTYQLERTLGQDDDGTMCEYLIGSVPNEVSFQYRQADKVVMDIAFIGTDVEQYAGSVGVKSGTRNTLISSDAFNTSSDFGRLKMHIIVAGNTNPDPLYAFLTEATITINNNASPNKALAVLGAFDITAGTFQVGGSVTAYFSDIAAVQAVRNNSDVTFDLALVKNNSGLLFDLPLISLGDGRLNIEQDQPVTLPLSMEAAQGSNNHTLLFNEFPYLPDLADA